jgi:ribosome-associated toxin RatA of RatAB toxin-antitoxin module
MRTVNSIQIHARLEDIFRLAAEIERWPYLLPHYRWVRTIRRSGDTSLVEMAAKRGWIPVKWTSVRQCAPQERRIYYKHVEGATTGMSVEWSFTPVDGGIDVTILHELTLTRPVIASRLGKWIVGRFFVEPIADRTLRHIKALAEGLSDVRAA